jgi:signal peptidase I
MQWEPVLAPDENEGEPAPGGLPAFAERAKPAGSFGLLKELPVLFVVALLAAFLVRTFVFQAFYIPSPSMGCADCPVHTLEIDDKVVVSKLSYRLHDPRRGDVVVFECPPAAGCDNTPPSSNPAVRAFRFVGERVGVIPPSTEDYIKRVVGLPGETLEGRNGKVYVDGVLLDEPYLPPTIVTSDFGPVPIPPDHLWVMGDNRQNSGDSRVFGAISEHSVVGRTVLRLLPVRRTAFL